MFTIAEGIFCEDFEMFAAFVRMFIQALERHEICHFIDFIKKLFKRHGIGKRTHLCKLFEKHAAFPEQNGIFLFGEGLHLEVDSSAVAGDFQHG